MHVKNQISCAGISIRGMLAKGGPAAVDDVLRYAEVNRIEFEHMLKVESVVQTNTISSILAKS